MEDQDLGRSFVSWRGDGQRAVVAPQEGVRGRAAPVVLRAARELPQHSAGRLIALRRRDPRREVRRRPAVDGGRLRVQGERGNHELAIGVGADRGIRARPEWRRAEVIDVRGEAHAQVADRKDRGDPEATLAELARAPSPVEAEPGAARQVDHVGPSRKRKCPEKGSDL